MAEIVLCPECGRAATVLERFSRTDGNGPAQYARLRCASLLSFLVAAAEIADEAVPIMLLPA